MDSNTNGGLNQRNGFTTAMMFPSALLFAVLSFVICCHDVSAQVSQTLPMPMRIPTPVARTEGALGIVTNPAGLAYSPGFELDLLWATYPGLPGRDTTFLTKFGSAGLGIDRVRTNGNDLTHYTAASAWRLGPRFAAGFSYQWVDEGENIFSLGLVRRLSPWLLSGLYATDFNRPEGRDPRITAGITFDLLHGNLQLSAEGTLYTDPANQIEYGDDFAPVLHLAASPYPGIVLRAIAGEKIFHLGLGVGLDRMSVGAVHRGDRNGDSSTGNITWLRVGDRRYESLVTRPQRWVRLKMQTIPGEEPVQLFGMFTLEKDTLLDLLLLLRDIEHDERIEGIVLELGGVNGGWASLQEIREALLKVKEAGKEILVYGNTFGMADLYIASVADSVFVPPSCTIMLTGLTSELPFFGGTLEKLGVKAEFVGIGEYKSAPESFERSEPSEQYLEMTNWLLDSLTRQYLDALAGGRGVTMAKAEDWFNHGPFTAQEALAAGLVDALAYPDQVFGDGGKARGDRRLESRAEYVSGKELDRRWIPPTRPKIAVIFATGTIVTGESSTGVLQGVIMGADTVTRVIRKARRDPAVAAIVLRVDSPGGSALASDLIWREVARTTDEADGKPLVVSMANTAASGGYYISCAADAVFARPATITGSIGIFGGKFDLSGLYEKIGFNVVSVERGKFAGAFSETRGLTEEERNRLRDILQEGYDQFVERVSDGRGLDYEEVDAIGRGRVWTGEQAVERGLVDQLGGLLDAIAEASDLAGLSGREVEIVRYSQDMTSPYRLPVGRFIWNQLSPVPQIDLGMSVISSVLEYVVHWEVLQRLGRDMSFYMMEAVLDPPGK